MGARSESVGKLWAAGTLSMAYPHGSARTSPQDASTSPSVTDLIAVLTVNSHAALLVFFVIVTPFSSLSTHPSSRSRDSLIKTDARQSPIRIKAAPLTRGKRAAPGSAEPQKNDRCQALSNCARHNRFCGFPWLWSRLRVAQGLGVSAPLSEITIIGSVEQPANQVSWL